MCALRRTNGGTLAATAALSVDSGATLFIDGTAAKTASGTITNGGTMVWTNTGNFAIVGVVHNLAGGLFEIQTDDLVDDIGGSPVFINEGVIRKTAGAGTTTWQVPIVNSGDIETQTGLQSMAGAGSQFNEGTRFLGAGVFTLPAAATFTGTNHSENLRITGGTHSGTNVFTGTVQWQGGTFDTASALTIATNGTLAMSGTSGKTVNGSLTNFGWITWTNTGSFAIGSAGIVHNQATGLFLIENDTFVDHVGGSPVFINEGVIRKTAGAGTTTWQVPIVNSGDIETQTGTMVLAGGSEFQNGTSLTGAGTNVLNSGTVTLTGSIFSENLQLAGATLTGSGSFNGSLDWLSGTIAAALDLFIPTNGILNLRSSGAKTINGTITNAGAIFWEGTGNLAIQGVLHNLPGALFEIRNDELLDHIGGTPIIVNEGTLRKVAGTNTTSSQILIRNSGLVEILAGTLNASGGFTNQGGAVRLGGGRLQLPAGRTLVLQGGSLGGHGTLIGHLHNDGQVAPSSTNGSLIVSGNYTNVLSGTLALELGGLTAGVDHSRLVVSNFAQLGGRILARLVNGFVPNTGDAFGVMTFAASSGDFVARDGFLILGQGRRLQTQFAPTSLTLTTIAAPDPERPSLAIQNVTGNIVLSWPAEFAGYFIQSNTNLTTTNWTTFSTNSFEIIPVDSNDPRRFFRLFKP